jgi:hypothetical protein
MRWKLQFFFAIVVRTLKGCDSIRLVKSLILLFLLVLIPLQAVIGAAQKISHHSVKISAVEHEHSSPDHDEHDHDASTTHCAVEDLCHSHGASVVSQPQIAAFNTCGADLINFSPQKIPSSLPSQIERPQWSPAV